VAQYPEHRTFLGDGVPKPTHCWRSVTSIWAMDVSGDKYRGKDHGSLAQQLMLCCVQNAGSTACLLYL